MKSTRLFMSCAAGLILLLAGAWMLFGQSIEDFIRSCHGVIIVSSSKLTAGPSEYRITQFAANGMKPFPDGLTRIDWKDASVSAVNVKEMRAQIGTNLTAVIAHTPFLRQRLWLTQWYDSARQVEPLEMTIEGDKGVLTLTFQANVLKEVLWKDAPSAGE